MKESQPEKNIYSFRDVEAMAWHHNTLPYYFEALSGSFFILYVAQFCKIVNNRFLDDRLSDCIIGGQTKLIVSKEYYLKVLGG